MTPNQVNEVCFGAGDQAAEALEQARRAMADTERAEWEPGSIRSPVKLAAEALRWQQAAEAWGELAMLATKARGAAEAAARAIEERAEELAEAKRAKGARA